MEGKIKAQNNVINII